MRATARTRIKKALDKVNQEIEAQTDRSSMYSRGLAREGYQGGYAQALTDALMALDGNTPTTRGYWES